MSTYIFHYFYRIQLSGNDPPKAFSRNSTSETDSSDEEETPEERGNCVYGDSGLFVTGSSGSKLKLKIKDSEKGRKS